MSILVEETNVLCVYMVVQIQMQTNYNPDANTDDGLCAFALVQGCTDDTACNYDPSAEQDNGSCVSAEPGLDCNGDCLSGTLLMVLIHMVTVVGASFTCY